MRAAEYSRVKWVGVCVHSVKRWKCGTRVYDLNPFYFFVLFCCYCAFLFVNYANNDGNNEKAKKKFVWIVFYIRDSRANTNLIRAHPLLCAKANLQMRQFNDHGNCYFCCWWWCLIRLSFLTSKKKKLNFL